MRKAMVGPFAAALVAGLLLTGGCGPKGDPAITGAGLGKEEALGRLRVVNDLRQLALASESYIGNNNDLFPVADGSGIEERDRVRDTSTQHFVGLSYRVYLLAFMTSDQNEPGQEQKIYDGLRKSKYALAPDAPATDKWNVPELKSVRLSMLSCPVPNKTAEPWHTYYRVFIGNGAAFEPKKQLRQKDFPDGLDKTILIVEAGEAVPWPKPEELPYDPAKPLPKLGGVFPDGFYAAFADGTVRFIKNDTDEKLIRAMITRNGGEPIAELPTKVDSQALRKAAGYND